jgi:hypothetical protein
VGGSTALLERKLEIIPAPVFGVAEAKELDITDVLLRTCAKEVPWVETGFGPRNLVETTPQHAPFFTFSHPEMQGALLAEAARAGAQARRGVTVEAIEPEPE